MNKQTLSVLLLVVLTMAITTACAGIGLSLDNPLSTQNSPQPQATPVLPPVSGASGDLLAAYQGTLQNIYGTVSPSVVNISVVQKVNAPDTTSELPGFPFFSLPEGQEAVPQFQGGTGSGFVWDQDGHIVTNNHVVSGADEIDVTFSDGTIAPAELVGADPDSDLAVIKVDLPADRLQPVQMADSDAVKVGQLAIAIGNPFGLEGTMTTGIVSALGRSLPTDETSLRSYTIPDIIQTDAPINPGNSGGVLVDVQGQVIGVTSAIESPVRANAGIGFAIPSAIVKNVVPALIEEGEYVHTWLGISGTSLVPDLAEAMDLDLSQRGALVEEVMPDSPADKAGLRGSDEPLTINGLTTNVGGDVITAIDDQAVTGMSDLIAYLASSTQPGQKAVLTILRDGNEEKLDVTLSARPTAEERSSENVPSVTRGIRLGITGLDVNPAVAEEMDLPEDQQGVLVQQVEPGSLADRAGLQAGSETVTIDGQEIVIGGDIVTALNGEIVAGIQELRAGLTELPTDHPLTLTVLRDGEEVEVEVQPGA